MAPLPGGTGSDLARGLGIGTVSDAVIVRALTVPARPIDVLRIETDADHHRFALNILWVYADSCGLKTAFLGNGGRNAATIFSLRYSSSR